MDFSGFTFVLRWKLLEEVKKHSLKFKQAVIKRDLLLCTVLKLNRKQSFFCILRQSVCTKVWKFSQFHHFSHFKVTQTQIPFLIPHKMHKKIPKKCRYPAISTSLKGTLTSWFEKTWFLLIDTYNFLLMPPLPAYSSSRRWIFKVRTPSTQLLTSSNNKFKRSFRLTVWKIHSLRWKLHFTCTVFTFLRLLHAPDGNLRLFLHTQTTNMIHFLRKKNNST